MDDYQREKRSGRQDNADGAWSHDPDMFYNPIEDEDRPGFIRKVYGILSIQLLFTAVFSGFCMYMRAIEAYNFIAFMLHPYFLMMAFSTQIVSILALTCCGLDRKFPTNYILLGIFTLSVSYTVGIVCMMVKYPEIVFEAAGITAAMVFGLTIYAIRTTNDFTMCGAAIWVLIMIMSVASLMCFMFGPQMHLAYACMGVFCYSFFLIHDTQMIVGGKHRRFQFDKDSYILAAISLYLDIINLFLYIIQILNEES